ncbi:MAG: Poly A polymerase, partial [Parcubacteria group bacterium GW2011_GWF2_44_17]
RKRRGNKITFYNHATVGARIARRMIKRLKLESAGVEKEQASWLIKHHMIAFSGDPKKLRNTTIERYFLSDRYPSEHLMTMIECDSRASVPLSPDRDNLHGLSIIKKRIAEIKKKPPKALLNGEEIMTILNIKPGVEVGKVIARLREAQLSGRVNTKLEARKFLQKLSVKS